MGKGIWEEIEELNREFVSLGSEHNIMLRGRTVLALCFKVVVKYFPYQISPFIWSAVWCSMVE